MTANPPKQVQGLVERRKEEPIIMLSDIPEGGLAVEEYAIVAAPLVIPEEIVDILDLEEVRPDMEVQVLSKDNEVLEEGARQPTRRNRSNEEVSSCHCLIVEGLSNEGTLGSRPCKRARHE